MATHYFFWDPVEDNIVQERDDTGAVTAEYATEPYLYGNLISQNRGGVESQYHFDSQGSTLALTNDSQQVTDTYAYSAFGEVTERTGNTVNPFQYGGQYGYYKDEVTGDIDIRRRPAQDGRWLSIDPLGVAVVTNGYIYVDSSSTNSTDPSGLLRVVPKAQLLGRQGCGKEPFITWDFLLDTVSQPKKQGSKKGAPCEGYIVQHVVVSCAVVRCVRGQCSIDLERVTPFEYWEAWKVHIGDPRSDESQDRGKANSNDKARALFLNNACGYYHQTGEVRFYCASAADPNGNGVGVDLSEWNNPADDGEKSTATEIAKHRQAF